MFLTPSITMNDYVVVSLSLKFVSLSLKTLNSKP